jgi:signal transduction histidine kinase
MLDLHDGLSGHLASIIALAEREHASSIEQTAREALDDLRVVIHSLDVGDTELTTPLAAYRERLDRQFKRLNIELDWSTAALPEISGVTPTHAIHVLRILQEAITNARKHGPATRIVVRGEAVGVAQGQFARITIENDGQAFNAQKASGQAGRGLASMQQRAAALGAVLRIESLAGNEEGQATAIMTGTRITLDLPLKLAP